MDQNSRTHLCLRNLLYKQVNGRYCDLFTAVQHTQSQRTWTAGCHHYFTQVQWSTASPLCVCVCVCVCDQCLAQV